MIPFLLCPSVRVCHPITLLRCADKRSVDIMIVFIESSNLQVELIRFRKECNCIHVYFLRSGRFDAISPTECKSAGFEHKSFLLRFRLVTASECMASIIEKICIFL